MRQNSAISSLLSKEHDAQQLTIHERRYAQQQQWREPTAQQRSRDDERVSPFNRPEKQVTLAYNKLTALRVRMTLSLPAAAASGSAILVAAEAWILATCDLAMAVRASTWVRSIFLFVYNNSPFERLLLSHSLSPLVVVRCGVHGMVRK
ncbi:MAG TPA: hypothetical protein VEF04_21250 [Blastocatellia bacterium]|nr:hypothetical protein [Blastocatellia bacterium]